MLASMKVSEKDDKCSKKTEGKWGRAHVAGLNGKEEQNGKKSAGGTQP